MPIEIGLQSRAGWREEAMTMELFIERYMRQSLQADSAEKQVALPAFVSREEAALQAAADNRALQPRIAQTTASLQPKQAHAASQSSSCAPMQATASGAAASEASASPPDRLASRSRSDDDTAHLDRTVCAVRDTAPGVSTPQHIAYLAQHRIFEQLPSLADDIREPDILVQGYERRNIWMGTRGTITPLHFDSLDNLFCQVAGYKYVRLYARTEEAKLYPDAADAKHGRRTARSQGNVSAVAVEAPNLQRYPQFAAARYSHAVVGPGDALFIPARCWHFVMALTTSISVNFWF